MFCKLTSNSVMSTKTAAKLQKVTYFLVCLGFFVTLLFCVGAGPRGCASWVGNLFLSFPGFVWIGLDVGHKLIVPIITAPGLGNMWTIFTTTFQLCSVSVCTL